MLTKIDENDLVATVIGELITVPAHRLHHYDIIVAMVYMLGLLLCMLL